MGTEVIRTKFPKQRDFVRFVLKREWADIFRVQLRGNSILQSKVLKDWCNEHASGRWSNSDANEVFYFENNNDAVFFRLRWIGAVPEIS